MVFFSIGIGKLGLCEEVAKRNENMESAQILYNMESAQILYNISFNFEFAKIITTQLSLSYFNNMFIISTIFS